MSLPLTIRQLSIILLVFGAIVLAVYGEALQHSFIALDDPFVIVNNLSIRSITPATLKHIFTSYDPELYTPLTFLTYQITYALGGLEPSWYHAFNLLFHGINATLVTLFFTLLLRNRALGIVGGLIFLLHPLNTEVVAWATARKEVLSGFFLLLSMILYLYSIDGKRRMFMLSILAFALGLLSKVNIAVLPALLILVDFFLQRPMTKATLIEKIPYVLLSAVFLAIGLIPKIGIFTSTTLMEKILMTAKSTMFYLWKFVLPLNLSVLYPNKNSISLFSPEYPLAMLGMIILLVIIGWSLKRTRVIAFGIGFFLIAISPTFGHFNRSVKIESGAATGIQFASDHYMYVPMIGLIVLVLSLLHTIWTLNGQTSKAEQRKYVLAVVFAGILVTFAILSAKQNTLWKNSETLFSHTLALYPYSSAARVNLSVIYRKTGRLEEEEKVLREGLAFGANSTLHVGLAAIDTRNGDFIGAHAEYDAALQADPTNSEVFFGLGTLLSAEGKTEAAMNAYYEALRLDPHYVAAENNIGSLLVSMGNEAEAKTHFLKAVTLNPTFREGYINLGRIAISAKRYKEAIPLFLRASELAPDDPVTHLELAQAYLSTGQNTLALSELKTILKNDPENAEAKAVIQEMIRLGILGTS